MKKLFKIICILFILLIFGTLFLQAAAISTTPLIKESSGNSSLSGGMMVVERSYSNLFAGSVGLRSVFMYILYLAIFAVIIRFAYKQKYFIKRIAFQHIRTNHRTTNERESDA